VTSLSVAAEAGCVEVVKLLIDAGADVNQVDKEDWSPLDRAEARGHQEIINILKAKLAASARHPNVSPLSAPPSTLLFTGIDEGGTSGKVTDSAPKVDAPASAKNITFPH